MVLLSAPNLNMKRLLMPIVVIQAIVIMMLLSVAFTGNGDSIVYMYANESQNISLPNLNKITQNLTQLDDKKELVIIQPTNFEDRSDNTRTNIERQNENILKKNTDSADANRNSSTSKNRILNRDDIQIWREQDWKKTMPKVTKEDKQINEFLGTFEKRCKEQFPFRSDFDKLKGTLPLCPCVSPLLVGQMLKASTSRILPPDIITGRSEDDILKKHPGIQMGGNWKPTDCIARQRLLVVVPYRDRQNHLRVMLNYLTPILQRQLLEYKIVVAEQAYPELFNKASVMNLAILELKKKYEFDCIIFHDVDMLLEDDRSIYMCYDVPSHIGAWVNKLGYRLWYDRMFGGVVGFPPKLFFKVNGYSNSFFGWGGEDDDMANRLISNNITKFRPPKEVTKYKMIVHQHDKKNPVNQDSVIAWSMKPALYVEDGLNSINYTVVDFQEKPLYTWLFAGLDSGYSKSSHDDKRYNYTVVDGDCPKKDIQGIDNISLESCKIFCDKNGYCVAITYLVFSKTSIKCWLKKEKCAVMTPYEYAKTYIKVQVGR